MIDPWTQDEFQIGFQQAPFAAWHVVLDSKRNRQLDAFPEQGLLGPDFGHLEISDGTPADSLDSFGNLEVTPPFSAGGRDYPFGRIYYGDNPAGNQMDARLRDFWARQRVTGQPPIQDPVTFNSDWLQVGHVDELMSIVPDAAGTHGWKVVLADPQLGVQLLAGGGGRPGVDPNLHTPRYVAFNRGGVTVDRRSSLMMRPLDLPVPAGSATIENYNLVEANRILFGTPAQGHLAGLRASIRGAFGLVDNDFILVPVLFNRVADYRGTGLGKAVAITPDLANGVVYAGTYIAPDNFLHNHTIVPLDEEDANADFSCIPSRMPRQRPASTPCGSVSHPPRPVLPAESLPVTSMTGR
jgi:protein-arginine deiminase